MGRNFIMAGALYVGISLSAWASTGTDFTDYDNEMREDVTSMESIVDPVYNRMVSMYIRWYAEGPKSYMSALIERSELYFPYIESKLHEAGLPEDLKFLVVIESALRPDIRSKVGAGGLWQLMTPTARYFGLRVNRNIDERLDPYRSTDAAIVYLKELYEQFGDWSLVMAAYNSGPTRVRQAIRLSGSTDFWELQYHLPSETQKYLPKFIAAQYFFTKADWSNFEPQPVPHDLMFTTDVRLTRPISLKEVAKVLQLDYDMLKYLNTSWKKGILGSEQNHYSLRIPSRVLQQWLAWEYNMNFGPIEDQQEEAAELLYAQGPQYLKFTYQVQHQEDLMAIAHSFGVKEYLIRYWNDLAMSDEVSEGQRLEIVIPSTHDCAYIADLLKDSPMPVLEGPSIDEVKSTDSQPFPAQMTPVTIVPRIRDHQKQEPVILPRGMSAAQYSFFAQEQK